MMLADRHGLRRESVRVGHLIWNPGNQGQHAVVAELNVEVIGTLGVLASIVPHLVVLSRGRGGMTAIGELGDANIYRIRLVISGATLDVSFQMPGNCLATLQVGASVSTMRKQ